MSDPTTTPPATCAAPGCLGHGDERTAEGLCLRCQGHRWLLVRPASAPEPASYTCQRCRAVLAGAHVVDPLMSEARRDRLVQRFRRAKEPPIPLGAVR